MEDTLKKLQSLVVQFRNERDWKQFHSVKDMMLSMILETSELAEHVQWKTEEQFEQYMDSNREAVEEELVDVLYWVLLIANDLEVDLEQAFIKKMQKNIKKYPVETAKGSAIKYSDQ